MSNYPPGVSGNEFAIAGPDKEWEEEMACSNEEFEYVMITPEAFKFASGFGYKIYRSNEIEFIRGNIEKFIREFNTHFNHSPMTGDTQYVSCGYVGEVMKYSYRDEIWWDCPQCGKRYEERISDYYGDE